MASASSHVDAMTRDAADAAAALGLVWRNQFADAARELTAAASRSLQGAFAEACFAFMQAFLTQEEAAMADGKAKLEALRARASSYDKDKTVSRAESSDPRKLLYQLTEAQASVLQALLMFLEPNWADALRGAMLLRSSYNAFETLAKTAGLTRELLLELGGPFQSLEGTARETYLQAATAAAVTPGQGSSAGASSAVAAPPAPSAAPGEAAPPAVPAASADSAASAAVTFPNELPPTASAACGGLPAVVIGGIAFGVGVFNLILSLLPPTQRTVAQWLGFTGDRPKGLAGLRTAVRAGGVYAAFANFVLISYHTSLAMFHTRGDGEGLIEAGMLMQRCLLLYPNSAIFLWYTGRWLRSAGAVTHATAAYERAYFSQTAWTSLQALCRYELAWCCMLTLRFRDAYAHFAVLAETTSWSKALCLFGAGANAMACHDYAQVYEKFNAVKGQLQVKAGRTPPFEVWSAERAARFVEAYEAQKTTLPSLSADQKLPAAPTASDGDLKPAEVSVEQALDLMNAVIAALQEGTDPDLVRLSPAATSDASGAAAAASGDLSGDSTPADTKDIVITTGDFLLFQPVLEFCFCWNASAQSTRMARFTLRYCSAWLSHVAATPDAEKSLYCAAHRRSETGSSGFLGLGKKAKVCAFPAEDRGWALLLQADAARQCGDVPLAEAALARLHSSIEAGHIAAESHMNPVPAYAEFQAGCLAAALGGTENALSHFERTQTVVGKHDVHFGNRLSFRCKQSSLDIKEGKAIVAPLTRPAQTAGAAAAGGSA